MSILQINNKQSTFALTTIALVSLLSVTYFLHPFTFDSASAETATGTASAEMSVNLDPTITIWTTDTSDNPITAANIAASPDESVATTAVRAHVSTNNLTGYTLTIQSNSTDAKMKHENTSVTKTIDPLTGSGTSSSSWASNSSLNNMWGYSIGANDSFVGVPGSSSSATTIDSTDAPNNDNYTDITFATKADLSLPAGTYTDTVIFSAVANAIPNTLKMAADKAGITTMQGLTQDVCAAADVYQSGEEDLTLTDTRDNSTYKVRKLADGNCWMTQNLRLINKTISSSDSNVSSGFTIPASSTSTGTTAGTWGTTNDANGINHTAAQYNNNTTYGAYYNWYTATAGSGTYSTGSGVSVDYSICPKSGSGNTKATSWHLPTGNTTGEWYNLMITKYGYKDQSSSSPNVADWTTTAPNLPFSGFVGGGSLGNTGSYGYFWSSTAYDSANGYYAYVGNGKTLYAGTYGNGKRFGGSVRCVLTAAR